MKQLFLNWMEKLGVPTKGFGFDYIKNTGWVTGAKILESIISYIIIVLISRYLGAEGLGQYSFLFSFSGLVFILADLGLSTLLVKNLAREKNKIDKYVSNILSLKLALATIVFILFTISIPFTGKENLLLALFIVAFYQIFSTIIYVPIGILTIKNKGRKLAIINIIERTVSLIGCIVLFSLGGGINSLVFVLLIATIIKTLISFIYTRKYFQFTLGIDFSFIKKLIMNSFPFLLIAVFSVIYIQMDTIMLSFIKGDEVVGWYQAGYKLINILNILPAILLVFGFPLFSKLYHSKKENVKKLLQKILQIGIIIIAPIVVGVFLLGGRAIEFIYSFQSTEAHIAFNILIIAEIFIFLTTILGSFIAAVDKQWTFALIGGIGAVVNIILNFILIKPYSLYGAGIATLITYFTMFILMHTYTNKKLLQFSIAKYAIIPTIASIIMFFVLKQLLQLNLIILVGIGIIIYALSSGISYYVLGKIRRIVTNHVI